jgi:hypothetical protein
MTDTVKPDLKKFQRAGIVGLRSDPGISHHLTAWALQALTGDQSDPRFVHEQDLEFMGTHPSIYLAERITTGIIRRPDLFSVDHKSDDQVMKTEEWLWPLLPKLLNAFARAYAYGARGVIFDWGQEDLEIQIPTGDSGKTRKKTFRAHNHYTSVHSIRRADFTVVANSDNLENITYFRQEFDPQRAYVLVWDPETEGDWIGQGARRRAWRDYLSLLIIDSLEANYLDRSVDPPRIAFVPAGSTTEGDDVAVDNAEYAIELMLALRGSGAIAFPSKTDAEGNKLWELDTLDIPDRESVFLQAIKRREQRLMISYLALLGGDAAASAMKTLDGILKEFIQDIANWVAAQLTLMVETVHRANADLHKVPPPEIKATDVGKAGALKLLKEILGMVDGGKISRWVDVHAALDTLGVPLLDEPEEPETPPQLQPGEPGPDPDMTSQRDGRRDDARTDEGADDTGQQGGREGSNE